MSILPIVLWPDARLTQVCAPVPDAGAVAALAHAMFETMYDAPGRGLAAPQVGMTCRLFVMDAGWKEGRRTPLACVNPEVLPSGEADVVMSEACLSVPGVTADVSRPACVVLRYTDLDGIGREAVLEGAEARIAQHEMDHLDGLMHFDRIAARDRAALLARYDALT